jgi:hypothetical protein
LIRTATNIDPSLARRDNIREGRIFALTVSVGFLVVALLAMRRGHYRVEAAAFSAAAAGVLAGLFIPAHLGPARRAWMMLGEAIGSLTTPIIMAVVYYFLLTPIAAVRRVAAGRKPHSTDSRWHQRPPLPPRERMERQF